MASLLVKVGHKVFYVPDRQIIKKGRTLDLLTLFENCSKCRIWIFEFWHFPPIFVLLKVTCLVTLFDRKLQVFKNSPKWIIFGIFNQLLSTQNVNVARFARNVEWDFFCDFQTPCKRSKKVAKSASTLVKLDQIRNELHAGELTYYMYV